MTLHLLSNPTGLIQSLGYVGVFILITLEIACIPIPSEITMAFAGYLASQGSLQLWAVILTGALGNLAGSLIAYSIGYILEESVLLGWIRRYGKFVLISEADYTKAASRFVSYGSSIVFFSRLLPVVRTFISLPAGMFEMDIKKFIAYTFLGSLAWSTLLTLVGYYLASQWQSIGPVFSKVQYALIALILVGVGYYIYHKLRPKK
jgi:membrane protein DedA with SNARE-associated domain